MLASWGNGRRGSIGPGPGKGTFRIVELSAPVIADTVSPRRRRPDRVSLEQTVIGRTRPHMQYRPCRALPRLPPEARWRAGPTHDGVTRGRERLCLQQPLGAVLSGH